jgi:hypothetical protein
MPRIVIKGFGSETSEVVEKVTSVMRTMSQKKILGSSQLS